MNHEIRESFPVALTSTYLNSAAIGPMPNVTVEAVTSQLNDVAQNGSAHLAEWLQTKTRVRAIIASMLGARAEDIAFTRNTSDGLCAVASGIDWQPGDNIVTFENEFPANFYPWRSVNERHGVELRFCRETDGALDVADLCGMIDERTKLVAMSAVQYSSGFRLDLERVGRVARAHGSLFAVDIIQAFGAMPIDVEAQFVDIAAGSSYKWLCAPEGCGIFYANERARERIRPAAMGWTGVERPWDFTDRDQPFLFDTRSWETGMGGTALLSGLEASLRLLVSTGIDKIAAHLAELTDLLCEIIPKRRYKIASLRTRGEKSQIVSLRPLNGVSSDEAVQRLADENVVVSSRGGALRIAPHFFNNFDDIERLAACLP